MASHPIETIAKWKKLVDHLVSLTDSGKLAWKETAEDDSYLTPVGEFTLNIKKISRRATDGEWIPYVVITLFNSEGKAIETFDDGDLVVDNDDPWSVPYFPRMNDLVNSIARKISGADQALDDILTIMSNRESDW